MNARYNYLKVFYGAIYLSSSGPWRFGRNLSASFIFVCYRIFCIFFLRRFQARKIAVSIFLSPSLTLSLSLTHCLALGLGNPLWATLHKLLARAPSFRPRLELGPLSSHAISIPVIFRTSSQGPKTASNLFGYPLFQGISLPAIPTHYLFRA